MRWRSYQRQQTRGHEVRGRNRRRRPMKGFRLALKKMANRGTWKS